MTWKWSGQSCDALRCKKAARRRHIVIARSEATKQSILSFRGGMDCFAALAMTARIRAPRWLAMTPAIG
jgi:hypothetical protein